MTIQLIAWDLDGTLIDSETLAAEVVYRCCYRHFGITVDAMSFSGKDVETIFEEIAIASGKPLTDEFVADLDREYTETMLTSLNATPDTALALDALSDKLHCVASNGDPDNIANCLEIAGLSHYFENAVYSARSVALPKPAPDLYLYAAEKMKVRPSECVVIEDTILGIRAGLAAGMHVLGFAGNKTEQVSTLAIEGVGVVEAMNEIPAAVRTLE